jgi:hypothetical protein
MDLSRFGLRMWESLRFGRGFLSEDIEPFISSVKNGEVDVDGTIWIPELRRMLTPLQMIIEHIHSMYDKNEAMSPCAREWHYVYERILAEVLKLDANPDTICQGFGGNTALFYFCENNGLYDRHEKMDIVKLLLQHGANASVYDNNGTSLLHRVAGCRHSRVEREWPELAEVLILGANVNAVDVMGNRANVNAVDVMGNRANATPPYIFLYVLVISRQLIFWYRMVQIYLPVTKMVRLLLMYTVRILN